MSLELDNLSGLQPTGSGVRSSGSRNSKTSHKRTSSKAVNPKSQPSSSSKAQRLLTEPTEHNPKYIRPTGPELVDSKHPSCSGLPLEWDTNHDRFIAYLATHAPLDRNGKVPRHEERRERYKSKDIARMVMETFPGLSGYIKVGAIETRLALLDQAGDNDFFKVPYGAYRKEEWGWGI